MNKELPFLLWSGKKVDAAGSTSVTRRAKLGYFLETAGTCIPSLTLSWVLSEANSTNFAHFFRVGVKGPIVELSIRTVFKVKDHEGLCAAQFLGAVYLLGSGLGAGGGDDRPTRTE